MKKMLLLTLVLASTLFMVACTDSETTETGDAPVGDMSTEGSDALIGSIPDETTGATEELVTEEMSATEELPMADEKVYVADAAIYRGTATPLEDGTFSLEQVEGTDFGATTMKFSVSDLTTGATDITEGNYLEVFYGRPMEGEFDSTITQEAIGMNDLGIADMVNFNGKVTAIQKEDDIITSITLLELITDQEVVFNVSEETQLYFAVDDLKEGDLLNIYHKGMMTRSLPPQGIPLEIRYMDAIEE